ncbi:putative S-adenosylmethionine-dependent methyltransferase/MSMEI_2290 [Thermoflexales bacterium]|nr:putative S-adenosylmethionine-dependent methyltransferase/MSMEI_2290 [Thermoflexales bacterium]
MTQSPPVIDYEGSKYSTEFWNSAREYEDRAERIAIRALLPPQGERLIDIGAGAGRLGDLYLGYDEVILMDYARSTIVEARERWGHDPRFKFVAADLYALPFVDGVFDSVVMIRVIHHIVDVPRALSNIRATLKPGSAFVFEFANKRHGKAIVRYLLRKQPWSPFDRKPIEFVQLNFDFHPAWMKQQLRAAGFSLRQTRAVSTFRLGALKRLFGAKRLAAIDGALQRPLAAVAVSPSIFTLCAPTPGPSPVVEQGRGVFACPTCGAPLPAHPLNDELCCANGHRWSVREGIYDFKTPV